MATAGMVSGAIGGIAQASGVLGATNQQQIFAARGRTLTQQKDELSAQFWRALASGNQKAANDLADQIAELTVAIAENSLAMKEAATAIINSRAEFVTGIANQGINIIKAMGGLVGQTVNNPAILKLLEGILAALKTQQTSLINQLRAVLPGIGSIDLSTPQGIEKFVSRVIPLVDKLPEGPLKDYIQGLINSLLSNQASIIENTGAIQELTQASDAQSWSTTAWEMFRTAVFNGAGGLLPQYQTALSSAGSGSSFGAGGTSGIMPRVGVSMQSGTVGGDEYHMHLTTPTEVLDPSDVARQIAFARNTGTFTRIG
jgi:hypothetical protein